MMPQGVSAIQARISAIESQFAPVPARPSTPVQTDSADFDAIFAQATSSAGTIGAAGTAPFTSSAASGVRQTMGAAGAPSDLAAYGNGTVPTSVLTPIPSSDGTSGHRLWGPAAQAFSAMEAEARRDGIAVRVTDSYRTLHSQHDLAERKGIYGQGGLAAVPGTSNHGWGRAVDIDTSGGTVEWLRANGDRFGFFEDVPGEPWHWTYRPA